MSESSNAENAKTDDGSSSAFLAAASALGLLDENATREIAIEAAKRREPAAAVALRTGALSSVDVDIAECLSRPREIAQGYEILGLLGRGGMGVVFRARQLALDREVALKTILASQVAEPTALARFEKEARVIGRLIHPHIVTAYDFGRDSGRVWLAMELLSGEDAFSRVRRDGPMAERLAIGIVRQAASGLAYAASQGVIHRDVKPANLMLTTPPPGISLPAGEPLVKVADFGLAILPSAGSGRLTATINMVGSPHYMAPEQFDHAEADERADIYALGVSAYELLVGQNPFSGMSLAAVVGKKLSGQWPPLASARPGLSPGVVELVRRMTAVDPKDRYANHSELLAAIDRLRDEASVVGQGSTKEMALTQEIPRSITKPSPAPVRATSPWSFVLPFVLTGLVLAGIAGAWRLLPDGAPTVRVPDPVREAPKPPDPQPDRSAPESPAPQDPEPTPPAGPTRDLRPGEFSASLFNGRSLLGWLIMMGTWMPDQGDDGVFLSGQDGVAERRLSASGKKEDPAPERFSLSLVVDVRSCERAEVHVDLPASDQLGKRLVLAIEQGQVQLGQKAHEDAPFTSDLEPVPLAEDVPFHAVTIERHSSAWFFTVDAKEVGAVEPLRAKTEGRFAIVAEKGVGKFSDLSVQSLE